MDTLCLLSLMPMARSSKMVFVALRPSLQYGTRRHSSSSSSRKSTLRANNKPYLVANLLHTQSISRPIRRIVVLRRTNQPQPIHYIFIRRTRIDCRRQHRCFYHWRCLQPLHRKDSRHLGPCRRLLLHVAAYRRWIDYESGMPQHRDIRSCEHYILGKRGAHGIGCVGFSSC